MSEADGLKGMLALIWNYNYSLPGIMEYAYMMRIVEMADAKLWKVCLIYRWIL